MIWTIIYLIGYIAAFIAFILAFREEDDIDLRTFLIILLLSISSWAGFIINIGAYLLAHMDDIIVIKQKKK